MATANQTTKTILAAQFAEQDRLFQEQLARIEAQIAANNAKRLADQQARNQRKIAEFEAKGQPYDIINGMVMARPVIVNTARPGVVDTTPLVSRDAPTPAAPVQRGFLPESMRPPEDTEEYILGIVNQDIPVDLKYDVNKDGKVTQEDAKLFTRNQNYTNIRKELENQYKNLVKLMPNAAYQGRSSDLNAIFNQQAAHLADAGVTSIANLEIKGGRLINRETGKIVTTSNLGGQVAVDRDTGVQKWGDVFSGVKGGANYGIQAMQDGSVILFPAWEKTKSPISQVGLGFLEPIIVPIATIAGTVIGGPVGAGVGNSIGQFLATGEVEFEQALVAAATAYVATEVSAATGGSAESVGKAVAPTASTATQVAIGEAAINAAIGAGIAVAAGGDPTTGAILGAAGSMTSTTYAQAVGKSIAPSASAAAQITIGSAVINSGISGIMAAATGGDIQKSMLAGAVKGAAIANTQVIAETLVGKENIQAVVKATNLKKAQVENIIATSVANGMISEVTGSGNFTDTMLRSLVSSGVGTSTANAVVNSINLDVAAEKGIFSATRNLASVATNAALRGENIEEALGMAAPGAILSGYQSYEQELDRQEAAKEKQVGAVQDGVLVAGPPSSDVLSQIKSQPLVGEKVVFSEYNPDADAQHTRIEGTRNDGTTYEYDIFTYDDGTVSYAAYDSNLQSQYFDVRPNLKNRNDLGLTTTEVASSGFERDIANTDAFTGNLDSGATGSPFVVGVDLRKEVAPGTSGGLAVIGGGGAPGGEAQWQIVGRDSATGAEKVDVNGEGFTLIALPDNKQALVKDVGQVVLYPEKDPVTNDVVLRPEPNPEIALKIISDASGGGGGGATQAPAPDNDRTGGAPSPSSQVLARQANQRALNRVLDMELAKLESQLQQAEAERYESEIALQRVLEQRGRFGNFVQVGGGQRPVTSTNARLSPETQRALEEEIRALESQLSESSRQIEDAAAEKERFGALQQKTEDLSDEDILSFLESGEIPGGRGEGEPGAVGGLGGDQEGVDGGTGGGRGGGAGAGEGDGTGPGAGGGEGDTDLATDIETRTPLSPALLFSQQLPERPETTPFASRVTGQALEGILGEKEPLFGGDEDEQRAVWNRRSLRLLSRALGL